MSRRAAVWALPSLSVRQRTDFTSVAPVSVPSFDRHRLGTESVVRSRQRASVGSVHLPKSRRGVLAMRAVVGTTTRPSADHWSPHSPLYKGGRVVVDLVAPGRPAGRPGIWGE